MKFVKKPIVIEAFRYGYHEIPEWCIDNEYIYHCSAVSIDYMLIKTLEGEMKAMPGDWIIKGIKDEIYPCKHDIFEATYELFTENN